MATALVSPDLTTTSLIVADRFGKAHRDVLRAIDNLEIQDEYRLRNFAQTEASRPSPLNGAPIKSRAISMTRDGFVLLVMGFTGKAAMEWKIRFLEAFNAMEAQLRAAPVQPSAVPSLPSPRVRSLENSLAHWQAIQSEAARRVGELSERIARAVLRPAEGASQRLYGGMARHPEDDDLALSLAPWEASAPLSPGQRYELRAAMQARLHAFGYSVHRDDYQKAWMALNAAMRVRSYRDIPQSRFAEALTCIGTINPFG